MKMQIKPGSIFLDRKHATTNRRFVVPVSDLSKEIVKCVAWYEYDGRPSYTTIAAARLTSTKAFKMMDVSEL